MSPWARDAAPWLGTAVGWDSCEAHHALPLGKGYRLRAKDTSLGPTAIPSWALWGEKPRSFGAGPGEQGSRPQVSGQGKHWKSQTTHSVSGPGQCPRKGLGAVPPESFTHYEPEFGWNSTRISQSASAPRHRRAGPSLAPAPMVGCRAPSSRVPAHQRAHQGNRSHIGHSGPSAGRSPIPTLGIAEFVVCVRMRQPPANRQRTTSSESLSAMIHSPDSADPAPSCNALQLAFCRHQPLTESVLPFRPVGAGFSPVPALKRTGSATCSEIDFLYGPRPPRSHNRGHYPEGAGSVRGLHDHCIDEIPSEG